MDRHDKARRKCRKEHQAEWQPTNGFGWKGYWCAKCGYSFFDEFDAWAKEVIDSLSSLTPNSKEQP